MKRETLAGIIIIVLLFALLGVTFLVGTFFGYQYLEHIIPLYGMLVPLAFFGIVIYKFKKEGVVAVLYFLGGLIILAGIITFNENGFGFVVMGIGVVLAGVASFLGKKWRIKIFGKKNVVSS